MVTTTRVTSRAVAPALRLGTRLVARLRLGAISALTTSSPARVMVSIANHGTGSLDPSTTTSFVTFITTRKALALATPNVGSAFTVGARMALAFIIGRIEGEGPLGNGTTAVTSSAT